MALKEGGVHLQQKLLHVKLLFKLKKKTGARNDDHPVN